MKTIDDLSRDVRTTLAGRDAILFDAQCVLCSGFFRFVLRYDRSQRFHFIRAQSQLGATLYKELDLDPVEFETNLVFVDGRIYQNLDAFTAAMRALGGIWSAFALLARLPVWMKRPVYGAIARNRYRLFGKQDACMMPDPILATRFLDADEGDVT